MTAPQFIGRAITMHLTGLNGFELDRLIREKRFPPPAMDSGYERWARSEVLEWTKHGECLETHLNRGRR
jgi:predicted DNA-binding transcriptional regulator AlpA